MRGCEQGYVAAYLSTSSLLLSYYYHYNLLPSASMPPKKGSKKAAEKEALDVYDINNINIIHLESEDE
jgi:hypothetical protein